jgi:HlyD family secretion protein
MNQTRQDRGSVLKDQRSRHTIDGGAHVVRGVPSLVHRGVVYLSALVIACTSIALYLGKANVIVDARGRIVPEADVVSVQALQGGVVNAVLAKAGDRLPAGATLLKLDLSERGMSVAELQQKRNAQRDQLARLKATRSLIDAILANPDDALRKTSNTVIATVGKTTDLVNELEDATSKVDAARGAIAGWPGRRVALEREIAMTRENVRINENNYTSQAQLLASTEAALVQKQSQLEGFRRLAERRLLSSLELGTEEERFRAAQAGAAESRRHVEQLELDISNQKLKLAELEGRIDSEPRAREAALRQAENSLRQMLALLRQDGENLDTERRELETALTATESRLKLAENQVSLTSVTMPVAGMLADLKVANAGELVALGQVVATVVPDGVPLVVEAAVPNRNVGFVTPGIEGRVKVDAYPFQQFGTLRARVRTVLPGLGRDNNFVVRLDLLDTRMPGGSTALPLFPGLAVEAELFTSRQRLINVILGPGTASAEGAAER